MREAGVHLRAALEVVEECAGLSSYVSRSDHATRTDPYFGEDERIHGGFDDTAAEGM